MRNIQRIVKVFEKLAHSAYRALGFSLLQNMESFETVNPFIFRLRSAEIINEEIKGTDIETGNQITIKPTINPRDYETLAKFTNEFNTSPEDVKRTFNYYIEDAFARAMIRFEYDYYWE